MGHVIDTLSKGEAGKDNNAAQAAAVKSAKEVMEMVSDDRDATTPDSNGYVQPGKAPIELKAQRIRNIIGTEVLLSQIKNETERKAVIATVKSLVKNGLPTGQSMQKLGVHEGNIVRAIQRGYNDNDRYYNMPTGSELGTYDFSDSKNKH
jgi:hypothetical protein